MKNLIKLIVFCISLLVTVSCNQAEIPSHGEPKEDNDVNAQLVGISRDTISVIKEFTYALHATVYPDHAAAKEVLWSSMNEDIAVVNDTGLVYGMEFGQTKIVLALKDGTLTDTCVVNVLPNDHVESVVVNPAETELILGDKITLEAIVLPEDSRVKDITWSTSDPEIASVNEKGMVEGLKEGTATITATSLDGGKTGTCVITVKRRAVTSVTLNTTEATLAPDGKLHLSAKVEPADAHYPEVTWSSSDPTVAEVDESGMVTAKALGTAVITVTTVDGGFTAQCMVTVEEPSITPTTLKLTFNLVPRPESLPNGKVEDGEYEIMADDGNKYVWEVYHGSTKQISYSSYLVIEYNTYFGTPIIPGATLKTLTFTQSAKTSTSRRSGMTSAKHEGSLQPEHYDGSVENINAGGLVATGTKDTDYTYTIANPVKEARYYLVGGAIGVSKIVLEYEIEQPPLELTFDMATCPASMEASKGDIPTGNYDLVATDGNSYSWSLYRAKHEKNGLTQHSGSYLVLGLWSYLGTPVIPDRKLVSFTLVQGASTKARHASMTTATYDEPLTETQYDAAEPTIGKDLNVGVKGGSFTFTIVNPQVEKMYYLVTTKSGVGVSQIVLKYE